VNVRIITLADLHFVDVGAKDAIVNALAGVLQAARSGVRFRVSGTMLRLPET
jgi:hypothetical protein